MCDTCPDLLSCQPTHCGGYAFGRPSVADIRAAGEDRRERKISAVEPHSRIGVREATTEKKK